jgi:hypothetical protein
VLACGLGCLSGLLMAHMEFIWNVRGPSVFLIIPLSWLVTMLAAGLLGALLPPPSPERTRGLTWQSVMQQKRTGKDES